MFRTGIVGCPIGRIKKSDEDGGGGHHICTTLARSAGHVSSPAPKRQLQDFRLRGVVEIERRYIVRTGGLRLSHLKPSLWGKGSRLPISYQRIMILFIIIQ